jgi:hypothetical protein
MRIRLFICAVLLLPALLQSATAASIEIETDLVPFAFKGYALNSVLTWDNYRAGVGFLGREVPEALAGNSGWTTRFDGAGIFFDQFFRCETAGPFIGVEGYYVSSEFELHHTGINVHQAQVMLGGRAGYRYNFSETSGLYIAPWLAVDYLFGGGTVTRNGRTYDQQRFSVFPGILVGWTFWDALPQDARY